MIRRRALAAGINAPLGNHSFRATGITPYLANGGALEHAHEEDVARRRLRQKQQAEPRHHRQQFMEDLSRFAAGYVITRDGHLEPPTSRLNTGVAMIIID